MDIDVTQTPNHPECIRCGKGIQSCPCDVIHYHYGLGMTDSKNNNHISKGEKQS